MESKMEKPHIKKILIANRSDTAIRIIHACKELGISTVAVHSTADSNSLHVKLADESVCIGPGPACKSYLNMQAIIAAAEITNVQAIHPGIGFLSENDKFAEIVEEHGLIFIGPKPSTIADFGSKIRARQIMAECGFDIIPGTIEPVNDLDSAKKIANKIGYPFMFKGAWCGGGKGIRLVKTESELNQAFEMACVEAERFSNKVDVYIEKYISNARHIEFQIACDEHGNCVHFGERDCSLQRTHQKIWEEAPSTVLTARMREELGAKICSVMRKVGYRGVGTVELLFDIEEKKAYFMEMNTRLQVEHTITESITGVDLVHLQIAIAQGLPLPFTQEDIMLNGHAIECRINAEDPQTFAPSPAQITTYLPPTGSGVRIESAAYAGYQIPLFYDSLLAKLIVHASTREQAIMKMKIALEEYIIEGPKTNIPLHLSLCKSDDVQKANFNTNWIEKILLKI